MPSKFWKGQWDAVAIASAVLLVFSFAFGGASRQHELRLALVELAALPLLVLSVDRLIRTGRWQTHRFALVLLATIVALPLVQLVPLPPSLWANLPGRDELVLALELAGLAPGWASLSLVPDRTFQSALALTPPVAFFLSMLTLDQHQRSRLVQLCLAAAVLGVLIGAAQFASGGQGPYPWPTTGRGTVAGFFANRNHLATFVLVALPFAVVGGAAALRRRIGNSLPLWLSALFAGLMVVALATIRSRAGIILFTPVFAASLVAAWIAAGRGRPRVELLVVVGAIGAALTAVAVLALPPILDRFDREGSPEVRFDRWPLVAETAQAYLPLGSGIGSFDAVYRSVEPLDELDATFFNQAHNEYLEIWLEAGWPGVAIIAAFALWYARRSWRAWKAPPSRERDLQRAASIGIAAIALHSIADYPLRTVALAVVFALCCGLLELAGRSDREARSS